MKKIKKSKIKKALKPSQRQSVTEFSTSFAGLDYDTSRKRKIIISRVLIVLGILALIFIGYVIMDSLICISELPAGEVTTI